MYGEKVHKFDKSVVFIPIIQYLWNKPKNIFISADKSWKINVFI